MQKGRVRKTLDRLAYASLILDVCIATITTLTFFDVKSTQPLLVPIDYLLTLVVVLSVVMFVVLLVLKSTEGMAVGDLAKASGPPDSPKDDYPAPTDGS